MKENVVDFYDTSIGYTVINHNEEARVMDSVGEENRRAGVGKVE
jgi:hypothetical protein